MFCIDKTNTSFKKVYKTRNKKYFKNFEAVSNLIAWLYYYYSKDFHAISCVHTNLV